MPAPRATQALPTRSLNRIIAEAFRRGWPFKVLPDGTVEVTPPATQSPQDPFELVDMGK
jgi:hypothetical protein